jgi:hypothetical protein
MDKYYWYTGFFILALGIIEIVYCVIYPFYKCEDISVFLVTAFTIDLVSGISITLHKIMYPNEQDIKNMFSTTILCQFILGIWASVLYFKKYNCHEIIPYIWPFVLVHFAIFWCMMCSIVLMIFRYCSVQIKSRTIFTRSITNNDDNIIEPISTEISGTIFTDVIRISSTSTISSAV